MALSLGLNAWGMSLKQICEAIDQEFYVLSDAHYQRYFLGGALAEKAAEEALIDMVARV